LPVRTCAVRLFASRTLPLKHMARPELLHRGISGSPSSNCTSKVVEGFSFVLLPLAHIYPNGLLHKERQARVLLNARKNDRNHSRFFLCPLIHVAADFHNVPIA